MSGHLNPQKMKFELMRKSAKQQRLAALYEEQVDANLFEENCDYEKDPTGLFWSEKDGFFFVEYVKRVNQHDNGWKNTFLQQNDAHFVAYVDANTAVVSELDDFIDALEENQLV